MITKLSKIEYLKGLRYKVYKEEVKAWIDGEVFAKRMIDDRPHYYVHFIEYNRRLDTWIPEEHVDFTSNQKRSKKPKAPSKNDEAAANRQANKKRKKKTKKGQRKRSKASVLPKENTNVASNGRLSSAAARKAAQLEEIVTQVRNIQQIELGRHRISPWYFSPYPEQFSRYPCIYLCEFCLKAVKSSTCLAHHLRKCALRHPPGKQIYRKDSLSIYEMDGCKYRTYSQNLCLLAKLFLDHKSLHYDTEPFLFYVFAECDDYGSHIVGFFSKEKKSADEYNVACILVLPQYQRRGYGNLMIELSYELSKIEGKLGTPEKPLSDLGLLSYRSFWGQTILEILVKISEQTPPREKISVADLCQKTSMKKDDVMATLQQLKVVNYYRSRHIIVITDEMKESVVRSEAKRKTRIDPSLIRWTPVDWSKK